MKVEIKYHDISTFNGKIHDLTELECSSLHTRDIPVNSIHASIGDALSVYVTELPARIDRQGDVVFLVSDQAAKRHPEPYYLVDPADPGIFGRPLTVWTRPDSLLEEAALR